MQAKLAILVSGACLFGCSDSPGKGGGTSDSGTAADMATEPDASAVGDANNAQGNDAATSGEVHCDVAPDWTRTVVPESRDNARLGLGPSGNPVLMYDRGIDAEVSAIDGAGLGDPLDLPARGDVEQFFFSPDGTLHALVENSSAVVYLRHPPETDAETMRFRDSGETGDLELGPDGRPMVAYSSTGAVDWAVREDLDTWTIEPAGEASSFRNATRAVLRLEADDTVEVCDVTYDRVTCAQRVGPSDWTTQVVFAAGRGGISPGAIALTGAGPARMALGELNGGQETSISWLARGDSGEWDFEARETIDESRLPSDFGPARVFSDGTESHVTYRRGTGDVLHAVRTSDGTWAHFGVSCGNDLVDVVDSLVTDTHVYVTTVAYAPGSQRQVFLHAMPR